MILTNEDKNISKTILIVVFYGIIQHVLKRVNPCFFCLMYGNIKGVSSCQAR